MRRSIMIVPVLIAALAMPAFAQQEYKTGQQMRQEAAPAGGSSTSIAADPAKQSNKPAERKSTNAEGAKQIKEEGK